MATVAVSLVCRRRCHSGDALPTGWDASGIRGWVMQCPASPGAGAPTGGVTCRWGDGEVEPGEGGRRGRPCAAEHCSTHPMLADTPAGVRADGIG